MLGEFCTGCLPLNPAFQHSTLLQLWMFMQYNLGPFLNVCSCSEVTSVQKAVSDLSFTTMSEDGFYHSSRTHSQDWACLLSNLRLVDGFIVVLANLFYSKCYTILSFVWVWVHFWDFFFPLRLPWKSQQRLKTVRCFVSEKGTYIQRTCMKYSHAVVWLKYVTSLFLLLLLVITLIALMSFIFISILSCCFKMIVFSKTAAV